MRGSLQDVPLPDLLQVVGNSRQHTAIEFRDQAGHNLAVLFLMGGMFTSIEPSDQDILGFARRLLKFKTNSLFEVYRLATPAPSKGLMSVDRLLIDLADDEPVSSVRIVRDEVMRGSLADVPLEDLLQVVGNSRQHTAVEFHDPTGQMVVSLMLKGGKVLSVWPESADPTEPLRQLLKPGQAPRSFVVYRLSERDSYGKPIASIFDLLPSIFDVPQALAPALVQPPPSVAPATPRMTEVPPTGPATSVDLPRPAPAAAPTAAAPAATAPAATTPAAAPVASAPATAPATTAPAATAPAAAAPAASAPAAAPAATAPAAAPAASTPAASAPTASTPAAARAEVPSVPAVEPPTPSGVAVRVPASSAAAPLGGPSPPEAPAATPATRQRTWIAIVSPKGGVGKTTISLHLAAALSQLGRKVLLVDADPNGDIVSALDAQARVQRGIYDVVAGQARAVDTVRTTMLPSLRVLPARGTDTDPMHLCQLVEGAQFWDAVTAVQQPDEIVLFDCPAGMFAASREVMRCCTEVIGVFQAETISMRSFSMIETGMASLDRKPELLGVLVNMFNRRSGPSFDAFHDVVNKGARYRLFETMIPRAEAFAEAAARGQPLVATQNQGKGNEFGFLFEMLAAEVVQRLGLPQQVPEAERPFLL